MTNALMRQTKIHLPSCHVQCTAKLPVALQILRAEIIHKEVEAIIHGLHIHNRATS